MKNACIPPLVFLDVKCWKTRRGAKSAHILTTIIDIQHWVKTLRFELKHSLLPSDTLLCICYNECSPFEHSHSILIAFHFSCMYRCKWQAVGNLTRLWRKQPLYLISEKAHFVTNMQKKAWYTKGKFLLRCVIFQEIKTAPRATSKPHLEPPQPHVFRPKIFSKPVLANSKRGLILII
jgi:hypothetical protein